MADILILFYDIHRNEALLDLSQSLRILSNLVAAGAIIHTIRDDIIFELLGLISALLSQKKIDAYDLIAKVCCFIFLWKYFFLITFGGCRSY